MFKFSNRDFKRFVKENPFVLEVPDHVLMHNVPIEMVLWAVSLKMIKVEKGIEIPKIDIFNGIKKIKEAI